MTKFTLLLMVIAATSCANQRAAAAPDILWDDPDRHPVEQPNERWSSKYWDAVDQTFFHQINKALLLKRGGPALNVNALQEVPNSSWYQNRLALTAVSPERMVQAACDEPIDTDAKWKVKSGKFGGFNPGFIIEDTSDGRTYLLKFDGEGDPERATAADVIGSIVYWAAGYNAPCNRVVYFDLDNIELAEDASKEDELGQDVPMTWADVEQAIKHAPRDGDRIRGSASLFLEGTPIGPFRYHGTRSDDPNDVIPHQHRRELRGGRLIAAWLNHFDARSANTLDTFVETAGGKGFVRHHMLDFGDCLGSQWANDQMSRRFGKSYYFDTKHVLTDYVTLGAIVRPWETVEEHPQAPTFGYYDVEHFDPVKWKPGYPNEAFLRMDEVDGWWAARTISRFTDEHVKALVDVGQFSTEERRDYLTRTLIGRRDKIVMHYLNELSALDRPSTDGARICFEDILVAGGYVPLEDSFYEFRVDGAAWEQPASTTVHGVCVDVEPHGADVVVEGRIRRGAQSSKPGKAARFHFQHHRGTLTLTRIER